MSLFMPTVAVNGVTDITPELLRALKAEAVLLDVDNTLALHGSQQPFEGTVEWTWKIRKAGFKIVIMSNNFESRVAPFADLFGLPFQSMCMKPFPRAYRIAARSLGVDPGESVVVGDQIFTDIVGANRAHMKSILLVPVGEEHSATFFIRRRLEKPFREKIGRTGLGKEYFNKE